MFFWGMLHQVSVKCIHCGSEDLAKNGHRTNGDQRWRSNSCKKSFRTLYRYKADEPGVKEQIVELTLNSAGVRDIGRTLKISKDTVCRVLKKKPAPGESLCCG
jgi:transposase-like protein